MQQRLALSGFKVLCGPIKRRDPLGRWLGETGAIFDEQPGDLRPSVSDGKMERRQTKPGVQGVNGVPLLEELANPVNLVALCGLMELAMPQIPVD